MFGLGTIDITVPLATSIVVSIVFVQVPVVLIDRIERTSRRWRLQYLVGIAINV